MDFPARFPSNESNEMGSFFWVGKAWFMCGSSSKGLRCNQHAPPNSKKFVRTGGTSQSLGKKAIFNFFENMNTMMVLIIA